MQQARALWYVAQGRAELRAEALPSPGAGEARVRMDYSALSRGTERLVLEGRAPPEEYAAMRAPMQAGDFPFPVKYGYCAVGHVEAGPETLVGRCVFALHPHQDVFIAPVDRLTVCPPDVPLPRATLAANMETALNAVWDSGAAPGDRIAVVGGGAVGLLIAYLVARLPGAEVTLVDPDSRRADTAAALDVVWRATADDLTGCDIVFHTSARAEGLATSLAVCGREGCVVEASWYGAGAVAAPLGGAFHARRLRLIATQVGAVAPGRRARWSHGRRLEKALMLLADRRLDALLTERVPFSAAAEAIPRLLAPNAPGVVTLFVY